MILAIYESPQGEEAMYGLYTWQTVRPTRDGIAGRSARGSESMGRRPSALSVSRAATTQRGGI